VRAVASSSPSVKELSSETVVSVSAVRPHATIAAGVCVFVVPAPEDGFSHRRMPRLIRFDLDHEVAAACDPPLSVDSSTTIACLRELERASGRTFAPSRAVEMLSRREHSETELRRKLLVRGYSPDAIDHAVGRVQDRDYQNDARFAAAWIRSRMQGRGVSRAALLAGLAKRGIDRGCARNAVSSYEDEFPGCFTRALQAAIRAQGEESEETIIRRLARRGFDVMEIRENIDCLS
jgi:regulatory protein